MICFCRLKTKVQATKMDSLNLNHKVHTIGLIGMGSIGERHLGNLAILFPESTILVCTSSGRSLATMSLPANATVLSNPNAILAKRPDWVVVASPASLHIQHSLPFISAGIPVLVEKPISDSLESAVALQKAVAKYSTPVAIGYCLRYKPDAIAVKEFLAQGVLGRIYNVSIEVGQFLPHWRDKDYRSSVSANKKLGGGALLELSHEIDYLLWLFGDVKLTFAQLRTGSELDLTVEEIVDAVFQLGDSALASLHLDLLQKSPSRKCKIIAERGNLEWDLLAHSVVHSDSIATRSVYHGDCNSSNAMYLAMLSDFANQVRHSVQFSGANVHDAVKVMAVVDKIKEKAKWIK